MTETERVELQNLRLVLTSPRLRAPGTLRSYMSTSSRFLVWLEDHFPPTARDLRLFFLERRQAGISERTSAKDFMHLKKLWGANPEWGNWPFVSEDRPVPDEDEFAPAFTPDEVLTIISRREAYSRQERYYLALSTFWGLRREEISRVRKRDIQGDTIKINVAKMKRRVIVTHLIPPEIMSVIEAWPPRERKADAISEAFQRIMEKSGLGRRPRWGMHSFRRTLLTMLTINLAKSDYPPALAATWMRWSKRSIGAAFMGAEMAGVYAHPEILQSGDPFALDHIIFGVHPFLEAWREEGGDDGDTVGQDRTGVD